MAVVYNEEKRIFTLHTARTSYQMMIDPYGNLLHLYYGPKLPDTAEYRLTHFDRGFSGNPNDAGEDRTYSLDALPQEFPTLGTGDYRNAALVVRNGDGSLDCDLRYVSHTVADGKYSLDGLPSAHADGVPAQTLSVVLRDRRTGAEATLLYGVLEETDIITRSVLVKNDGKEAFTLERVYSACLDFLYGSFDVLSFYGRHAMERNLQRAPLGHGTFSVGSGRGTSSHQYNPMLILAEHGASETAGNGYAMSFVYSGGFSAKAEKDQYDGARLLMGLPEEQFSYLLKPGETFTAPEVVMTFSGNGLEGVSHNLQDCVRANICRGPWKDRPRPVLVNSWEASYFDFTGASLLRLADKAAELGIEMLVLDDGWFGERDDDDHSLGDWVVNEKELGCTLSELSEQIHKKGLLFGLWFEPEMVNEQSALYREHPDWALAIPGKPPVRGRNQLVLDFSRPCVVDAIYDQMAAVLSGARIDYVKWDMNRSLCDIYSAETGHQGTVLYNYVLGVYALLDRLQKAFPDILWEGCSGGGGRFDMGMMYYTPQIWCSDNTDAIDRTRIQYGTSFGYPLSVMGAHVSTVPNHQTGRKVSMETRGTVAMTGAFGFELDLNKLTADEEREVRALVEDYHELAPLLLSGKYYRLSDPFTDPYCAWMSADAAGDKALLSLVLLERHANWPVEYVRLRGLAPEGVYRERSSGKRFSGAALLYAGLPVILQNNDGFKVRGGEYQSFTWLFERVE